MKAIVWWRVRDPLRRAREPGGDAFFVRMAIIARVAIESSSPKAAHCGEKKRWAATYNIKKAIIIINEIKSIKRGKTRTGQKLARDSKCEWQKW